MIQNECAIVTGIYKFVNLAFKGNDLGQGSGSENLCSFPAFLMFSQNKLF